MTNDELPRGESSEVTGPNKVGIGIPRGERSTMVASRGTESSEDDEAPRSLPGASSRRTIVSSDDERKTEE